MVFFLFIYSFFNVRICAKFRLSNSLNGIYAVGGLNVISSDTQAEREIPEKYAGKVTLRGFLFAMLIEMT